MASKKDKPVSEELQRGLMRLLNADLNVLRAEREAALTRAKVINPDLLPHHRYRTVKKLLQSGLTPEMFATSIDTPVETIVVSAEIVGKIDQDYTGAVDKRIKQAVKAGLSKSRRSIQSYRDTVIGDECNVEFDC